jgi:autotransporter-associated beta strand protein
LPSLDGPGQTLPALYTLPAADFHDIVYDASTISTSDNTMPGPSIGPSPTYDPGAGYDLATGLGSPVGNVLIPELAGPSMLAFAQGPTSALAGASIVPSITVDVEDALGNIVTSDNSDVTLSIGNNPAGGSLQGTLTVAAVNGVATFSGLDINTVGNGYTLVVSDGGLAHATSAAFNITPDPPTIATPAAASLDPVTGTTVGLSVLGADAAGESNLTYTWSATTLPDGALPPTFSDNGDNTAKNTTATFSQAGNYVFTVTITDPAGLSITGSVSVAVDQTLTSFSLAAAPGNGFNPDMFQATALDQFGTALASQPSPPWSLDNDGIDFNSTAGATVVLDGESPSFADVTFSGTGYTIVQQGSGGTLLLANGNSAATLTAAAGKDTIGVPVVLQSNVVVLPAAGSQLILSRGISGPGQFTVDAPGNVIFTAANTYTGGTTVSAGTLTITTPSAIATGTSLTVNAGGVFIFDPAATTTPSTAAVATATTAVSTNASIAAVDTPAAAAVSSVPSLAAVATQTPALPLAALPQVASSSPAGGRLAARSPDASDLHAVVMSQFVGPLAAKPLSSLTLPHVGEDGKETASAKIAGNPAWAWLAATGTDGSDWRQQKDVAIGALDAMFADYGAANQ